SIRSGSPPPAGGCRHRGASPTPCRTPGRSDSAPHRVLCRGLQLEQPCCHLPRSVAVPPPMYWAGLFRDPPSPGGNLVRRLCPTTDIRWRRRPGCGRTPPSSCVVHTNRTCVLSARLRPRHAEESRFRPLGGGSRARSQGLLARPPRKARSQGPLAGPAHSGRSPGPHADRYAPAGRLIQDLRGWALRWCQRASSPSSLTVQIASHTRPGGTPSARASSAVLLPSGASTMSCAREEAYAPNQSRMACWNSECFTAARILRFLEGPAPWRTHVVAAGTRRALGSGTRRALGSGTRRALRSGTRRALR